MLVDLGGGTLPHPRADVVIDLHHPKNSPAQDASVTPWAVNPGHWLNEGGQDYIHGDLVDEVYASHFMEHIHRGQPLINVMNEAWRVLRPGGTFTMILPLVGYTDPHTGAPMSNHIGWQPWADPTHVNYWWFPEAIYYFCQGMFAPHADYGTKVWGPAGSWIPEDEATAKLESFRSTPAPERDSWWSVRGTWEGIFRIYKP